jgi:sugar phosphate isomerase/epimerase
MKHKLVAQLYTLRDECQKDFPGVLRELKKMGWGGVQISGLHGYEAKEIAEVLNETGLAVAGMHVGLDEMQNDLPSLLEQAALFNTKDFIFPWIPDDGRSVENYKAIRGGLNEVATKLADQGYRISYHNHDFEFDTVVEGKNALEYLLEPTDDNHVLAEIDVYWVKKAGKDPLEFIKPYANRMPIIHLKDMADNEEKSFAEVGTGLIDFYPILQWGEGNGIEWYAVEQDVCPGNPMDSLQISLNNLHKLIDEKF